MARVDERPLLSAGEIAGETSCSRSSRDATKEIEDKHSDKQNFIEMMMNAFTAGAVRSACIFMFVALLVGVGYAGATGNGGDLIRGGLRDVVSIIHVTFTKTVNQVTFYTGELTGEKVDNDIDMEGGGGAYCSPIGTEERVPQNSTRACNTAHDGCNLKLSGNDTVALLCSSSTDNRVIDKDSNCGVDHTTHITCSGWAAHIVSSAGSFLKNSHQCYAFQANCCITADDADPDSAVCNGVDKCWYQDCSDPGPINNSTACAQAGGFLWSQGCVNV